MRVVYSFEAKSIQNYILDSSKLIDRIGASEQIENLCRKDGLLDQVLEELHLVKDQHIQFSRRAGGTFVAIFNGDESSQLQNAENLQAVWTFAVQSALSGLAFAQGIGKAEDIIQAVKNADTEKRRNQYRLFPNLPVAGPLVTRSQRTGLPAVQVERDERLDLTTVKKRRQNTGYLIEKLNSDAEIYWPKYLPGVDDDANVDRKEPFPLHKDNRYIAILHADGNGIGEIAIKLLDVGPEHYIEASQAFSEAIEAASIEAAQIATRDVLRRFAVNQARVMPARPLVLAGDEISFILRGDVAAPFTVAYLEAFEEKSRESFEKGKLRDRFRSLNLPEHLTACAGIAFIKASQPFYQGYRLAASLCEFAKNHPLQSRSVSIKPSRLAFHRITTSVIEHFEPIREHELVTENKNVLLSLQPYRIGNVQEGNEPCFTDLRDLSCLLEKMGVATARELLTLLHIDPGQAQHRYGRWCKIMQKTAQTGDLLDDFRSCMKKLLGSSEIAKTPGDFSEMMGLTRAADQPRFKTPLGDALALYSVRKGGDDDCQA